MQITRCSDYREMSGKAASFVLEEIGNNPGLLLCAATGGSPAGLYSELARAASKDALIFNRLRILKLDEWGGVPENHPATCEYFIQNKLLTPLRIPPERYIAFTSDPENPEDECNRIHSKVVSEGPIDVCILGLGTNGHLGLNEPSPSLEPYCHVAALSKETLGHSMIGSMERKPGYGLTLGMQEILSANCIIMLVTGKGKKSVSERFLEGKISTDLPASFLWLHPRVECLVDRTALE
jgi:galactosamine-6-phosphate isomerase